MRKIWDTIELQSNGHTAGAVGASVRITTDLAGLLLAPIFADDGITAAANPVTTDALGYWEATVVDGIYFYHITHPNLAVALIRGPATVGVGVTSAFASTVINDSASSGATVAEALDNKADASDLIELQSTGLTSGGGLEISAGDNTRPNILNGAGKIVDDTDPLNTTVTKITWPDFLENPVIGIGDAVNVYLTKFSLPLYVDTAIDVPQTGRLNLFIGTLFRDGSAANSIILVARFTPHYTQNHFQQFVQFMKLLGSITLGLVYGPSLTTSLGLSRSAGLIGEVGINAAALSTEPVNIIGHIATTSLLPPKWITSVRSGSNTWIRHPPLAPPAEPTFFTEIIPSQWDDGTGPIATATSQKWLVNRMFMGQTTGIGILHLGQITYGSLQLARESIDEGPAPESNPAIAENTVFRGWIIVRAGALDHSETVFREAPRIPGVGTGLAGIVHGSLQEGFDINNEIIVTAAKALRLKAGILSADRVLEFVDSIDQVAGWITGQGDFVGGSVSAFQKISVAGSALGRSIIELQDDLGVPKIRHAYDSPIGNYAVEDIAEGVDAYLWDSFLKTFFASPAGDFALRFGELVNRISNDATATSMLADAIITEFAAKKFTKSQTIRVLSDGTEINYSPLHSWVEQDTFYAASEENTLWDFDNSGGSTLLQHSSLNCLDYREIGGIVLKVDSDAIVGNRGALKRASRGMGLDEQDVWMPIRFAMEQFSIDDNTHPDKYISISPSSNPETEPDSLFIRMVPNMNNTIHTLTLVNRVTGIDNIEAMGDLATPLSALPENITEVGLFYDGSTGQARAYINGVLKASIDNVLQNITNSFSHRIKIAPTTTLTGGGRSEFMIFSTESITQKKT